MNLLISRALSCDAGGERDPLAHGAPAGLLDLAVGERLQGHRRFTSFSSRTCTSARSRSSVAEREPDLAVGQLDGRAGVLEVEPGGDLAMGLVDGVADLLQVDFGNDIEGGHVPERYRGATWVGARVAKGS